MHPKEAGVLFLYILITQATPWTPSTYTFIIDSIRTTVNTAALLTQLMYYNSLPGSHKTILHDLMKIIVGSYGLLTLIAYISNSFINLMPKTTVALLHHYPIVICWSSKGFVFDQIFFFNTLLLILLRAYFNCYPNMLFNVKEKIWWIIFAGCNLAYLVETNIFYFQQSNQMCKLDFIEKLKIAMKLKVDDAKIETYKGLSIVSLIVLLMAPLAEILSRIVIKIRSSIKKKLNNKYRLQNTQSRSRNLGVTNKSLMIKHTISNSFDSNEIDNVSEDEPIQKDGRVSAKDKFRNFNSELTLTVKDISFAGSPVNKNFSPQRNNHALNATTAKMNINTINVEPVNSESIGLDDIIVISSSYEDQGIKSFETNEHPESLKITTPAKLAKPSSLPFTNRETSSNPKQEMNIGIGFFGLNILIAIFIVFFALKFLRKFESIDKDTYLYISLWFNLNLGKLIDTLLPLYWLLRKHHSKDYAIRKIQIFKDSIIQTMTTQFNY